MPNHLSILGIIHTAISIIAILTALFALLRDGKIDPKNGAGRLYILLIVLTCITGLPIMKTGHLTPGHFLAIIILAILPIGIYAKRVRIFGKAADYIQIVVMSATLFFSFIPAVVETLTRLPISQPLAADANAPIIQKGLLILVILFVAGLTYQLIKLKSRKKAIKNSTMKLT